jgi:hypothetical protein
VSKLDEHYSQAYRPGFWRNWAAAERSILPKTLCILCRAESGRITGLGAMRPLPVGFRLGPLYSESTDVAMRILKQILYGVPSHSVLVIDVHQSNTEAVQLYRTLGLQEVLRTKYMWKEKACHFLDGIKVRSIFALASLDFN